MFLMPALLTMSITATRMYRSLSDVVSSIDEYESLLLHAHSGRSESSQSTRLRHPPEKQSQSPEHQTFPLRARSAQPGGSERECVTLHGPIYNTTAVSMFLIHRLGQPGAQPTVRIDYDG